MWSSTKKEFSLYSLSLYLYVLIWGFGWRCGVGVGVGEVFGCWTVSMYVQIYGIYTDGMFYILLCLKTSCASLLCAPLLKVILLSVECWLRRNYFVLSREGEEFSWEPTPAYPLLKMYPPNVVTISCFVSFVIKAAQRRKCVRSRHYSSCVRASPLQSI